MSKSKICIRFTILFFVNVSFYFNVINTIDQEPFCKKSVEVSNGKCSSTDNGHNGMSHECTMTCDKYYQVTPSISMVCGFKKHWIGESPTCERVLCDKPKPPKNGRAKCASTNIANKYSSCTLTCENQYKMSNGKDNKDELTIQCYLDSNGNPTWDSFLSECKSIPPTPCKKPSFQWPLDGECSDHHCKLWCVPGYQLEGKNKMDCFNEEWSEIMSTCQNPSNFPIVPQPCKKNTVQAMLCKSFPTTLRKKRNILKIFANKCYDWMELYKNHGSYIKTHYKFEDDEFSIIKRNKFTFDCILVTDIAGKYDGRSNCEELCRSTFIQSTKNITIGGYNVGNINVTRTCICVTKHFYKYFGFEE